jgi:hypothetical protein
MGLPTPFFKLAVHERWYTTKHENLTPTTPLHPYTPTPFFKLGQAAVALIGLKQTATTAAETEPVYDWER